MTKIEPTKEVVREALSKVLDPELNLSVVELGLIRDIEILPGLITIQMILTTPFCPYAPELLADVKKSVMNATFTMCEVNLLPEPWSPDMMEDPGLLGYR